MGEGFQLKKIISRDLRNRPGMPSTLRIFSWSDNGSMESVVERMEWLIDKRGSD
jgi:hypothetical protein